MQNMTVQFQKYLPTQGHFSTVLFLNCLTNAAATRASHHSPSSDNMRTVSDITNLAVDHHTARIIVQHRLERQKTSRDPVLAETVSCSWTRDPTKTVMHSVPEVELCRGVLLCNAANTDAGITSAGTYIINQLVCTY